MNPVRDGSVERRPDNEVTVNAERRLYVIPCLCDGEVSGYTCLGFEVAYRKAYAVAAWIGSETPARDLFDGIEGYEVYRALMEAGMAYAKLTGDRCPAELNPHLIGLEGWRIEVTDVYGEVRRFWVGKSTGWMPCHLAIARKFKDRPSGGDAISPAVRYRVVKPLYREVAR